MLNVAGAVLGYARLHFGPDRAASNFSRPQAVPNLDNPKDANVRKNGFEMDGFADDPELCPANRRIVSM